jgi:hypothetical protein
METVEPLIMRICGRWMVSAYLHLSSVNGTAVALMRTIDASQPCFDVRAVHRKLN